jgi:hypothetical protein
VGLQEEQQGLPLGFGDAGEPEGAGADEQPLRPVRRWARTTG